MRAKVAVKILLLILLTGSCNNKTSYKDKVKIEGEWHQDSLKEFSFRILDTASIHEMSLFLKTNNNYPYRNVHFFTYLINPDSTMFLDTASFDISDVRGRKLGDKGFNSKRKHKLLLDKIKFKKKGTYHFLVQQGMRTVNLEGIENIGLIIKKTNENK